MTDPTKDQEQQPKGQDTPSEKDTAPNTSGSGIPPEDVAAGSTRNTSSVTEGSEETYSSMDDAAIKGHI